MIDAYIIKFIDMLWLYPFIVAGVLFILTRGRK